MKKVCKVEELIIDSGVCVLVDNKQIALFYIENKVYAIDNYDPIGKSFVLARGIVSDINGKLTIASPLYKEHYDLINGECLEDENVKINVYDCKIEDGYVFLDYSL